MTATKASDETKASNATKAVNVIEPVVAIALNTFRETVRDRILYALIFSSLQSLLS